MLADFFLFRMLQRKERKEESKKLSYEGGDCSCLLGWDFFPIQEPSENNIAFNRAHVPAEVCHCKQPLWLVRLPAMEEERWRSL
jgi:hypothetical protein